MDYSGRGFRDRSNPSDVARMQGFAYISPVKVEFSSPHRCFRQTPQVLVTPVGFLLLAP
jgi:hypothetical protein